MTEIGNLKTKLSFEQTGDSNLTDLSRDLKGIRSEMNNFRSSSRAYRTSVKGMRQESDILTRRLDVQRERVAELKRRYDESVRVNGENSNSTRELAAQYNNAQAQMKRTEQQLDRLNQLIRTQESGWTRLGERLETAGQRMQTFGRATTRFGQQYSMRVTAPILAAGAAAIKVGIDFEEGMSRVQAVSGATAEDMEKLKSQAKELGESTRFSARETANGMEFLARAGWNTSEIMAGMPGLLDLAASSAMDLGRAADVTSNIMSSFNIEAEKSGYVADVLAHAAANANTDVEQMAEAMKYVAPTANTLGLSMEETAAAIMEFSNNGIQGSMAGRAFGTSLLRLSDPTEKMKKEMEKLGISFFDANNEMKPLSQIVSELEKSMKGYGKEQRAATLATLFGTEAQRHWAILLDQGSKSLANNTKELENSEGAASKMAKVMQDNAKGAMVEFRSALEGAGIAAAEHVIPALTDLTKKGTDLIRKFGELDKEQQQQILKWIAMAGAVGPAAIVIGNVSTALGGVLRVGGSVAKMLGRASGAGLVGRLATLGGPAGIAVAAGGGLAYLGYKLYDAHKESKKLHDISLETTNKLWEQADSLEELIDKYENLQLKSRLTGDEFGRMLDIQKELERVQDPASVAALEQEYEELAEKSGLTNKELEQMVALNNDIVEQSPGVEKAITEQGNSYIDATSGVREYIEALREMSFMELELEREKALENENKLLEEQAKLQEDIAAKNKEIQLAIDARGKSEEEIEHRLREIDSLLRSGKGTEEERLELAQEQKVLTDIEKQGRLEVLESLQEEYQQLLEKRDLNEEELAKLEEINVRMAEMILSEVDLNWEKGKGLDKLDERISKLQAERDEMVKNAQQEGVSLENIQNELNKQDELIYKHESVRDRLNEKIGYQSEHNRKIEEQNRSLRATERYLIDSQGNIRRIGVEQDKTNKKIGEGVSEALDLNKELSKDATKTLDITTSPAISTLNQQLTSPLSRILNVQTRGGVTAAYASNTSYSPDNMMIVGGIT